MDASKSNILFTRSNIMDVSSTQYFARGRVPGPEGMDCYVTVLIFKKFTFLALFVFILGIIIFLVFFV